MRTPTKPFVNFCGLLLINYLSNPFVINKSATAGTLHVPYLTICTPPMPTFPPPLCRETTCNSGLPTTEINLSKPLLIRSEMWWITPQMEIRPTPLPRSSQLLSIYCSILGSSMMTANSGGASQMMKRPGHASNNSSQLPTKNGGSCISPRPVPLSSRPITPIKMTLLKPSQTLRWPLPVIAPRSQLSLRPIYPDHQLHWHSFTSPHRPSGPRQAAGYRCRPLQENWRCRHQFLCYPTQPLLLDVRLLLQPH